MPSQYRSSVRIRLLESLPAGDQRRLLTECKIVELTYAEGLHSPGTKLAHVYFPTSSFISLIMPVSKATGLEVGLIGNEGMFGFSLVLGVDGSHVRAVVQGAGAALSMDAAVFRRALDRSKALHSCIDRYVFVQKNPPTHPFL